MTGTIVTRDVNGLNMDSQNESERTKESSWITFLQTLLGQQGTGRICTGAVVRPITKNSKPPSVKVGREVETAVLMAVIGPLARSRSRSRSRHRS